MSKNSNLSGRELEILDLVATGAGNKQIADHLSISTNTVKVHLRNIFTKLGVASRTEAALIAIRDDLISVDGFVQKRYLPSATEKEIRNSEGTFGKFNKKSGVDTWTMSLALVGMLLLAIVGMYILLRSDNAIGTLKNPPSPVPISSRWEPQPDLPTPRTGMAVTTYENKIYAIGGDSLSGVTNVVEAYDPGTKLWSTLLEKPTAVAFASAEVIGGDIFVPGGITSDGKPTDVLEVFTPAAGLWQVRSPLPQALSSYSMVAFEGRLYLFGGWTGEKAVDDVYEYDPQLDKWNIKTPLPTARRSSGAAVIGNLIYVVGGFDGEGDVAENGTYSPERENTEDGPWSIQSPMPVALEGIGSISIAEILFIFGLDPQSTKAMQFEYFHQENRWDMKEGMTNGKRKNFGLAVIGNNIHIFGGEMDGSHIGAHHSFQAVYTLLIPMIQ